MDKSGSLTGDSVTNIITLVVGVGLLVILIVFLGSMLGSTFDITQTQNNQIGQQQDTYESVAVNFTVNDSAPRYFGSPNSNGAYPIECLNPTLYRVE